MKVQVPESMKAEEVVKRMFWLAWQACGGPLGTGVLQDNPGANEDTIWEQVLTQGDYPGRSHLKKGEVYGDYVFGRMIKLMVRYTDTEIELDGHEPRSDYQAWCVKFPSYKLLFDAAVEAVAV